MSDLNKLAERRNVSPAEWRDLLRRSRELYSRATYDPSAREKLKEVNRRIRLLGNMPVDGSSPWHTRAFKDQSK